MKISANTSIIGSGTNSKALSVSNGSISLANQTSIGLTGIDIMPTSLLVSGYFTGSSNHLLKINSAPYYGLTNTSGATGTPIGNAYTNTNIYGYTILSVRGDRIVSIGSLGPSTSNYVSTSTSGATGFADPNEINSGTQSDEYINNTSAYARTTDSGTGVFSVAYGGEVLRVHQGDATKSTNPLAIYSYRQIYAPTSSTGNVNWYRNYRAVTIGNSISNGGGTLRVHDYFYGDIFMQTMQIGFNYKTSTSGGYIGYSSGMLTMFNDNGSPVKNYISIGGIQTNRSLIIYGAGATPSFVSNINSGYYGHTFLNVSDYSTNTGSITYSISFVGTAFGGFQFSLGSIIRVTNTANNKQFYTFNITEATASNWLQTRTGSTPYANPYVLGTYSAREDIFQVTGNGNTYVKGSIIAGVPTVYDNNNSFVRFQVSPQGIMHLGISSTASPQIHLDSLSPYTSSVTSVDPTTISMGDITYSYTGSMSFPFIGIGVASGVKSYFGLLNRKVVSWTYSATYSDETIAVDTSLTASHIYLPNANQVPAGKKINVVDNYGNAAVRNISIGPLAGDSVVPTSATISTNYSSIQFESDGSSKWYNLKA